MKNKTKKTDNQFLFEQDNHNKNKYDECYYDFGKYIEYNGLDIKNLRNPFFDKK